MTEQWQELKETITELRDNDGTATQQEVCKFLANLIDVLEKQMPEPKTEEVIKMRDATPEEIELIDKYIKSISNPIGVDFWDLEQEPKTGHWIYKPMEGQFCSICDEQSVWKFNYCPNCGAKMEVSE